MQPQPQQFPQQPQVQQQQQPYGGWQQQQGPSSPYGGYGTPSGYGSGSMSPQMTGMPYSNGYGGGLAQQYPQQQQYSGYSSPQYSDASYPGFGGQQGYAQPQPQPNVSEFDPLRSQSQASSSNPGPGPSGEPHPREYIRTHKQELEMWDNVSWRQALNSFDSLRVAWESHKSQVGMRLQQGGYYLGPVEGQRLQDLQKQADHNIDTVTASRVQMQEVLSGYRHSADLASKNRVRESLNAALTGLPDWPPQNW
ncbi:uncharacterized protein FOMMEDRAFT_138496 [Fomitiporia mediterranea MF3/22]|uniref:uncharacterized protein n=1 Tax=Fomitiporia mediterranea (strain MF3/22) TaxID=694068 RepID=UPI0004407CAC|nr:uncharacterized protein FOMMEDRAFT_138496 [Fomitiporia mediterranea MF3/22]EJD06587.1 hypothetical protein FOMMEDRAFT_138496 [Fomitiporia mediterranea MF3/22]